MFSLRAVLLATVTLLASTLLASTLLASTLLATVLPATGAYAAPVPTSPVPPAAPVAAPAPPADAAMRLLAIRLIARQEAVKAGLPFDLVDAVIKIESDYRPDRIGDVGEIGLMQVRPGTAALLGFRGTAAELSTPLNNIHYGATYLGQAWRQTNGDVCRTLMKYRAGHGEEAMSALSAAYCARARAHLTSVGSVLAAAVRDDDLRVTKPTVAAATILPLPVVGRGRPRNSAAYWARFETRIGRINAGIEAKWRRLASR